MFVTFHDIKTSLHILCFCVTCTVQALFAFPSSVFISRSSVEMTSAAPAVVLVGIDGLGAHYLKQMTQVTLATTMPNFVHLFSTAAFATMNARTIFPPISAPVWMTVLSGMTPDQTGIVGNSWPFLEDEAIPPVPIVCSEAQPAIPKTLFDMCGGQGAAFTSWSWFARVCPRVVAKFADCEEDDDKVVQCFMGLEGPLLPPFTFLHLDDVDETGHHTSWGSDKYYEAAAAADRRLGLVVERIKAHFSGRQLVHVVVVSDHGGSETGHGDMKASHMEVPIIVWSSGNDGATQSKPDPPVGWNDVSIVEPPAFGLGRLLSTLRLRLRSCLGERNLSTCVVLH